MNENELIQNIAKIHTTEMGFERIKRNLKLKLTNEQILEFCTKKILDSTALIERSGKNWYVRIDGIIITVNAHSFTIITAHKN